MKLNSDTIIYYKDYYDYKLSFYNKYRLYLKRIYPNVNFYFTENGYVKLNNDEGRLEGIKLGVSTYKQLTESLVKKFKFDDVKFEFTEGKYADVANALEMDIVGPLPYMLYSRLHMAWNGLTDLCEEYNGKKHSFSNRPCNSIGSRLNIFQHYIDEHVHLILTSCDDPDLLFIVSFNRYLTTIELLANEFNIDYNIMYKIIYTPKNITEDEWKVIESIKKVDYGSDWSHHGENIFKYDEFDIKSLREKKADTNKNIQDTVKDTLEDFIYTINDSNKLSIVSKYESINEFFQSNFENDSEFTIICSDTKKPLITISKDIKNNKDVYIFKVNITTDDDDSFNMKTVFNTAEQFNNLLSTTISALKDYKIFYKYIEDLEKYL